MEGSFGTTRMRLPLHSLVLILTSCPHALPAVRSRFSLGSAPEWQPAAVQLAVKIGCTADENETLVLPQTHVPDEQVRPGAHTWPHEPQLAGSVAVSTQALPQTVPPLAHPHLPDAQVWGLKQELPHMPQLAGSVCSLTHDEPQSSSPLAHAQWPLLHVVPLGQTVPQPPQLPRSVLVLTHTPLHGEVPVGHVHVLPMQLAPEGHVLPHPAQLRLLVAVSTHDEPHCVSDPHPEVHMPALHTRPGSQT